MAEFTTYGTESVNGPLVPVYERSAFAPGMGLAPQFRGRGAVPPTINDVSPASLGIVGAIDEAPLNQSDGANMAQAQLAMDHPWDVRLSPVVWSIIFLVVGVFLLQKVHWRG